MQARFDAAQTGSQNRNHWAAADDLSPNLSTRTNVRRTLRRRARLERENDPHFDGLTKTLAYDMIGTGPRLQLTVEVDLHDAAMVVMKSFKAWVRAAGMAEKFRLLVEPQPADGETFGQFTTNEMIDHPVKLDLKVMEAEQIATPLWGGTEFNLFDPLAIDGIEYDKAGNPTIYHVLKEHPGDGVFWGIKADKVPAEFMVHWFRPRRPGQARGVSEFASALETGAQTRRYGKAVLSAAETAANISGIMKTTGSADAGGEAPKFDTMEEVDIPRNALLTLPEGWDASQLKAEQPTGTYKEFVGDKRAEMGRPVLAPFNVTTGNSSGYNYSSGRLDHVPYHRVVWIERERFRHLVLDKLFRAWLAEAASVAGLIPVELGPVNTWEWEWQWDGFVSIDPYKDATAIELRLRLNLTTLAAECAADGLDWREVVDQRAVEREYMRAKGIDPDASIGLTKPVVPGAPMDPNAPEPGPNDPNAYDDDSLEDTDLAPTRRGRVYA